MPLLYAVTSLDPSWQRLCHLKGCLLVLMVGRGKWGSWVPTIENLNRDVELASLLLTNPWPKQLIWPWFQRRKARSWWAEVISSHSFPVRWSTHHAFYDCSGSFSLWLPTPLVPLSSTTIISGKDFLSPVPCGLIRWIYKWTDLPHYLSTASGQTQNLNGKGDGKLIHLDRANWLNHF